MPERPTLTPLEEAALKVFPSSFDLDENDLRIVPKDDMKTSPDFHFERFGKSTPIGYCFKVGNTEYSVWIDDEFLDEQYEDRANFWKPEVYALLRASFSRGWIKVNDRD